MSIIPETATKYKFEGIGKASATALFLALAANPSTIALTQGFWGKIVFFFATWLFSGLASMGLVVLNVGIAKIEVLNQKEHFDGSWDEAFKVIAEKGGNLTDAEKAAIDNKVIHAFREFASFSKV